MYFHAPCGVVLYSVMLCLYIVECSCKFYEHKRQKSVYPVLLHAVCSFSVLVKLAWWME